jgi:UDP-glucose 4-epimerase
MTILITGGAGFIGSHLAEHFNGRAAVRVFDNFRTGSRERLNGTEALVIEGDILDRDALRSAMQGVDFVFHLAAMVSVAESTAQVIECERINALGTLHVLEEAAAAKVKKVFFASSAAVYGDNPVVPKVETMLPEPRSPYGITKLTGEHYCRFFHDEGRVPTVCLRFFNVFGPRQDPHSAYAAVVPAFLARAQQHQPLTIFGDGEQTRDFISVKDIVAAILHVTLTRDITGVFNTGCGTAITVNALASHIVAAAKSRSEIHHLPGRPGDVRHSTADISRLLATGFRPSVSLAQGLQGMLVPSA